MDGKQLEINLDGNEQLEFDLKTEEEKTNPSVSRTSIHKVYVAKTKAQKQDERTK